MVFYWFHFSFLSLSLSNFSSSATWRMYIHQVHVHIEDGEEIICHFFNSLFYLIQLCLFVFISLFILFLHLIRLVHVILFYSFIHEFLNFLVFKCSIFETKPNSRKKNNQFICHLILLMLIQWHDEIRSSKWFWIENSSFSL